LNPSRTILLFLFLTVWVPVTAQEIDSAAVIEENMMPPEPDSGSPQNGAALEMEIGQLIIDNTFSKAGSDFQQLFNTRWSWPQQNTEQFIITISERPSFLNSTLIEITINDLKVFERFLQPRYDVLEELATQAIAITLQYILNYEDVVKELSGEDLSGSGIY
jgi:curli production assembly/transport component CsgE